MMGMDIAEQLRLATEAAISAGATRNEIAEGSSVDDAAFTAWLDDRTDIPISTAAKLARYHDLELRPSEKIAAKHKVNAPAMPAVDWGTAEPRKKPKDEGRERERGKQQIETQQVS